jgi:DNA-directed RNA polymerase subunit RPC12/RpoP
MPIMPIRFRCAYCNQLMAIARRKAGSVVRCPTCAGQVVVPDPRQPERGQEKAAAEVFERPDFEAPLKQSAKAGGHGAAPQARHAAAARHVELEPITLNEGPGVFLSAGKIVLLIFLLLVLLGVSFVAGAVVGRSLWPA